MSKKASLEVLKRDRNIHEKNQITNLDQGYSLLRIYSLCPKNIVRFLESWKMTSFETPYVKNKWTGFKFRGVAVFDQNYSDAKFESRPVILFWDMKRQSCVFLNLLETVQYFWDRGSMTLIENLFLSRPEHYLPHLKCRSRT